MPISDIFLIFSEMRGDFERWKRNFPQRLPEPADYFRGLEFPERPRVRNLLVFLRQTKGKLRQRNFANRMHYRHVLILVLETGGEVLLEGVSIRLEPGEGLLVCPYQLHHYTKLDNDRLRWLFITFETDGGEAWLRHIAGLVLCPGSAALDVWAEIAASWQDGAAPERRAECLPRLEQLLLNLGRNGGRQRGAPAAPIQRVEGSWGARMQALLIDSVEKRRNVAEVAAVAGLSERQLRNRFKAAVGIGIRRFRANYQLHRAAALLREGTTTISRTAELCGFNSASVFTRFIRRETGMSPKAWRSFLREGENTPSGH